MSEHVESLLVELVALQKQTNQLLGQLIQVQSQLVQVLAEDGAGPEVERPVYMDGTPVC